MLMNKISRNHCIFKFHWFFVLDIFHINFAIVYFLSLCFCCLFSFCSKKLTDKVTNRQMDKQKKGQTAKWTNRKGDKPLQFLDPEIILKSRILTSQYVLSQQVLGLNQCVGLRQLQTLQTWYRDPPMASLSHLAWQSLHVLRIGN